MQISIIGFTAVLFFSTV